MSKIKDYNIDTLFKECNTENHYWIFEAGGSGLKITVFEMSNYKREIGKCEKKKCDLTLLKQQGEIKAHYTCIKSSGFMLKKQKEEKKEEYENIERYLTSLEGLKESSSNNFPINNFPITGGIMKKYDVNEIQKIEALYECESYNYESFFPNVNYTYISMGSTTVQIVDVTDGNLNIEPLNNSEFKINLDGFIKEMNIILQQKKKDGYKIILTGNFLNLFHPQTEEDKYLLKNLIIPLLDQSKIELKICVVANSKKKNSVT